MGMRVGYARVSTDKAEQDISIEAQVQQLTAAGCDRVIRERGSAYREGRRRPGWEELQALVASGRVTEVIAVSQSRLSRKGDEVPFLRICARRGVTVRFLDGTPSDIDDPASRLMTGILSTVNEVDSMIKGINVRNGIRRRRAEGHYACGRVPFGYLYDGSQVVSHPSHFKTARVLWDQLAECEFMLGRAIRLYQLDWSITGLGRWIHNPILRGVVAGEPDRVTALITWDEYHHACRLTERRKRSCLRSPKTIRFASGLVRCQRCGKYMQYLQDRVRCNNLHCEWRGRGLSERKVRAQVMQALNSAAMRLGTVATAAEPMVMPPDTQAQQHLEQLLNMQAAGVPGLEQAIADLEASLIPTPPPSGPDWRTLAELFSLPGAFDAATDEELRVLALEYIAEILYTGNRGHVEITVRQGPSCDAS